MDLEIQCLNREEFDKAVSFCKETNIGFDFWGFTLEFTSPKDLAKVAKHIAGSVKVSKVVTLLKGGRYLQTVRIDSYGDPDEDLKSAIAAAKLEDFSDVTLTR